MGRKVFRITGGYRIDHAKPFKVGTYGALALFQTAVSLPRSTFAKQC